MAAAVGSLIIRLQTRPANSQASLVAYFCESLKYAGTVTTAFLTLHPVLWSAHSFNFSNTLADIYSG